MDEALGRRSDFDLDRSIARVLSARLRGLLLDLLGGVTSSGALMCSSRWCDDEEAIAQSPANGSSASFQNVEHITTLAKFIRAGEMPRLS